MNPSSALPSFSVIMPAYNSARLLPRALESVLTQRDVLAEIIVVDDASTDATPEVMTGYSKQVRYLRQHTNRGVAAARNYGAAHATGDWLAFLDADDFYYSHRLALHAEWITQDLALDFLTGDYHYRGPDGEDLGSSMVQHPSGRRMREKAGSAARVVMKFDDFEAFVAEYFGDTHTLILPRATFQALGGYPEDFNICEDVYLLTRLVARSRRIGVCCEPMGVYVVPAGSSTRRDPFQAQFENVRTLEQLRSIAREFPASVRQGVRRRLRQARLNLAYALVKAGRRAAAISAVLPSLLEHPGLGTTRDVISILKG